MVIPRRTTFQKRHDRRRLVGVQRMHRIRQLYIVVHTPILNQCLNSVIRNEIRVCQSLSCLRADNEAEINPLTNEGTLIRFSVHNAAIHTHNIQHKELEKEFLQIDKRMEANVITKNLPRITLTSTDAKLDSRRHPLEDTSSSITARLHVRTFAINDSACRTCLKQLLKFINCMTQFHIRLLEPFRRYFIINNAIKNCL
nr:hypothetical protein Itr_chr08CG01690 [Ipomoea trifida]